MANNTSPRSQNISETDFFAAYKPIHVRLSKYGANTKVTPKVTATPITPPSERSQMVKSASKLTPTSAPFTLPHTPPPESTRNTSYPASKLSPSAKPFISPAASLPRQPRPVVMSSIQQSKLSPTAPGFVAPAPARPQQVRTPSPSGASTKLSPNAAPFTMPAPAAPKQLEDEDAFKPVQRIILVAGNSGPWPQYGVACNDDNIVTVTGSQQDDLEFDDCVSEAGLENQPRQVVRATQGEDATNQLIDWDGKSWAPPPASWEHDRAQFTGKFIPNYIREWSESVPSGKSVSVDTSNEAFLLGKAPIDNDVIIAPLSQPTILRNPKPDGDRPTVAPTSDEASLKVLNAARLLKEKQEGFRIASQKALEEIAALPPVVNELAPSVEMYLRPVEPKDAAGIAAIYNMEMQMSPIPEDQHPVTVEQIAWLIQDTQKKAPFIVALRGPCPILHSMHNDEQVIGFARAEAFDFGLAGAANGRSRGTANLSLYVHRQFRRKHVGYSLMDRLLHMLTPAHAYMAYAKWANPGQKKYAESNGCGAWHQLFFKIPVFKRADPTYEWLKNFLYNRFYFKEAAKLISAARSSCVRGGAEFMDLVFLQREASASAEFEHFM